jgi:hypothetical protein
MFLLTLLVVLLLGVGMLVDIGIGRWVERLRENGTERTSDTATGQETTKDGQ